MGQVQLILREDVHRLGEAGSLVSVKPGYARNFLLPTGKAMLATDSRVNELEHKRSMITERLAKERKSFEALRQKVESTQLSFTAQAGEEGKLFGSITAQQVADQLAEKGIEVDRRKIVLDEPIKSVGDHSVKLRLSADLAAEIKVKVEASE
jgi:large subunit ribosomal protein L9